MAGLLTHVIAGLFCTIVVHIIHFNWKYSSSIFIGNLFPDIIKFGIVAVRDFTLNIYSITKTNLYKILEQQSSMATNWLTLGFFVFAVTAFLFHFHIIRKKTMEDYDLLYVFLIIGVLLHLVMDVMILEASPWI